MWMTGGPVFNQAEATAKAIGQPSEMIVDPFEENDMLHHLAKCLGNSCQWWIDSEHHYLSAT